MVHKSGREGVKTEETVLPPWVRSARQRLASLPKTEAPPDSAAQPAGQKKSEDRGESVGGTVSRKGKKLRPDGKPYAEFGYTCEKCPNLGWRSVAENKGDFSFTGPNHKYFPIRCKSCKSKMRRYTCASRNYKKLDLLRQIEGRPNLKFVTFTHTDWNMKIPFEMGWVAWNVAEQIKKKATKKFNNWRNRNKYWISREAKGMCYYECTMKTEWPYDEIQLHFHIHTVVCSKRIENKDIQTNLDTLEPIPMSTTIQRNWGGIVDVRKCKTWKHKDGEVKTSRRFVMNYLLDYINKAAHWQSTKFGDWSN